MSSLLTTAGETDDRMPPSIPATYSWTNSIIECSSRSFFTVFGVIFSLVCNDALGRHSLLMDGKSVVQCIYLPSISNFGEVRGARA
jgi:hypothetical protein